MTNKVTPEAVVRFWSEAGTERWYRKDEAFDREISDLYGETHAAATHGDLDAWAETATGALALVLVLDQFSRNMFRGSAKAFAQDAKASGLAQRAIAAGFDRAVAPELRQFFSLPLMHSESLPDQELCVKLCHGLPTQGTIGYARDHERIIRRFGRFPHRNAVLGRHTSPAEQAFLDNGGFAG